MFFRVLWHSLWDQPSWAILVWPPTTWCCLHPPVDCCCNFNGGSYLLPDQSATRTGCNHQSLWRISYARADPSDQDFLQQGSGAYSVCPLSLLLVEVVGWCFNIVWICPWHFLALGPPGNCRSKSVDACVLPEATQHQITKWSANSGYLFSAWRCLDEVKLWTNARCY